MSKKRIALISVWFPPTKGVAVNRMEAFADYIGTQHDVTVITLGEKEINEQKAFGRVFYIRKGNFWKKLKHKQSDNKLVHHSKSLINIITHRIGLSAYKSWKKRALKLLTELQAESGFDIVISSYSPVEAHDVAYQFKKRYPKVLWFADMRDEMSGNPFEQESVKRKLRTKEKLYENSITLLTSIAAPILDEFKVLMPQVKHFIEVRNGFNHNIEPLQNFNKKFTVVYAGTFYGKRKPDNFFEGVLNLLRSGQIGEDLHFRFIGTNHNFYIPEELKRFVEFVPQIQYEEAVQMMAEADCNLLINPPLGTKGQYSGKIFDYASVQKPILAYVDMQDVAAELIEEFNAGIAVEFDDIKAGEEAFKKLYDLWRNHSLFPVRRDKTQELHRKYQIEKINDFIQTLD